MSGFKKDEDRNVIPRWRSFDQTIKFGELNSTLPVNPPKYEFGSDFLAEKKSSWLKHRTVGHASDLVGAALTLGREAEATEAAEYLINSNAMVSPWARELAKRVLGGSKGLANVLETTASTSGILYGKIRKLRRNLKVESKDPITWVELSLMYITLGLENQAERCMIIALELAPTNRYVLRSACRLWLHIGNSERAHDVVVKAETCRYDPWLLAAEIAISNVNNKTPKFVKTARGLITSQRYSYHHTSELASALATLELGAGRLKTSKKLFDISLKQPTENSIAQVAWASNHHPRIRFVVHNTEHLNAFEAESWINYQNGEWEQAIVQCESWLYDQMFSSWPSAFGSYVSGTALENYDKCIWFSKQGLVANPKDFTLLNNLAFGYINQGNINEGKKALSNINRTGLSNQESIVLNATEGLLAYRSGDSILGNHLYLEARNKANRLGVDGYKLLALATAYHVREELLNNSKRQSLVQEANQVLRRIEDDPLFRALESRLQALTEN